MLGENHLRRRPQDTSSQIYSHSRTRTTSSNVFPLQTQSPTPMHLQQPPQLGIGHNRRSPSVNTFSTVSTIPPPAAFRTSPTSDIRRSTSVRSGGGQPTSYVALLRKQKATVWCDRAQYEDPRMVAQQRAAKQRANMEVIGGSGHARTSTGITSAGKVAAKIRHHGKPGVVGYAPENNYIGVGGVPMRLSATEVEGEDSDDDDVTMQRLHHRRTGSSGRSSTASGRRGIPYRTSGSLGHGKKWSPGDTPERPGSLVEEQAEYQIGDDQELGRAQSTRSGSSGERADALPELNAPSAAKLASNSLLNAAMTREKSVRNPEDLRRRGSVDERTSTLTGGRLFIANPD
ncbi:hypothetical protein BJ170DRAFT_109067 [Xylariales sp. AK1849]|nr:hypothetical protein BJ170DRAFT_109067 [Xylariales sp. AK1849]